MQVMKKLATDQHQESYYNSIRSKNKTRIKSAINGMSDVQDICFMRVEGKSQLKKEIEETKHVRNKTIDMKALHRNEQTHENEEGGLFCKS